MQSDGGNSRNSNTESRVSLLNRRKFLVFSGVATTGMLGAYFLRKKGESVEGISKGYAQLKDFKMNIEIPDLEEAPQDGFYSIKPVKGIPESWVDDKGLDVLRYANYIQNIGLKHITPYDVLYPHFKTRGRHKNSLPSKYMWRNIVPTLIVIDKMATHMKARPKPFVSVYRSPAYNRSVRGRAKSQHLINGAVDIQFYGISSATVAEVARRYRDAGYFKGAVGSYRSFTHIDTRGYNVNW